MADNTKNNPANSRLNVCWSHLLLPSPTGEGNFFGLTLSDVTNDDEASTKCRVVALGLVVVGRDFEHRAAKDVRATDFLVLIDLSELTLDQRCCR